MVVLPPSHISTLLFMHWPLSRDTKNIPLELTNIALLSSTGPACRLRREAHTQPPFLVLEIRTPLSTSTCSTNPLHLPHPRAGSRRSPRIKSLSVRRRSTTTNVDGIRSTTRITSREALGLLELSWGVVSSLAQPCQHLDGEHRRTERQPVLWRD